MGNKRALLIAAALVCGASPSAEGQSRGRPAPAAVPAPDATRAVEHGGDETGAVEGEGDSGRGSASDGDLWDRFRGWAARAGGLAGVVHGGLARYLGGAGAWAAIASPLLLLLVAVLRRRRRRPVPRRQVAGAARAGGAAAPATRGKGRGRQRGKRATVALSAVEEPVEAGPAPLEVDGAQDLLLRPDNRGGASLHETLCALGVDPVAVEALRLALAQCLDETSWSAAVADRAVDRVPKIRARWIGETAGQRLAAWVGVHPLVAEFGYRVDSAAAEVDDGGWQIKLLLTQPSGLAASLDDGQQRLLQRVEAGLDTICGAARNPHSLVAVARQTEFAALLPQPEDPLGTLRLAVLCHGVEAFERAAALGLVETERSHQLQSALAEHERTVGGRVGAAGCGVHALLQMESHAAAVPAIGTLLAAISGAAFSASAVTLRLSKQAGVMRPAAQREALGALGQWAMQWLVEPGKGGALQFEANLRRLLGHDALEQAAGVARAALRTAGKQPLWRAGSIGSPDVALLQLHERLLDNLREQAAAAERRARAILTRLAYAGQAGENIDIATCRLGYAVAGLGSELVRGADPEVLSMLREAMAALRADS